MQKASLTWLKKLSLRCTEANRILTLVSAQPPSHAEQTPQFKKCSKFSRSHAAFKVRLAQIFHSSCLTLGSKSAENDSRLQQPWSFLGACLPQQCLFCLHPASAAWNNFWALGQCGGAVWCSMWCQGACFASNLCTQASGVHTACSFCSGENFPCQSQSLAAYLQQRSSPISQQAAPISHSSSLLG